MVEHRKTGDLGFDSQLECLIGFSSSMVERRHIFVFGVLVLTGSTQSCNLSSLGSNPRHPTILGQSYLTASISGSYPERYRFDSDLTHHLNRVLRVRIPLHQAVRLVYSETVSHPTF